jgi:hypothetical protein
MNEIITLQDIKMFLEGILKDELFAANPGVFALSTLRRIQEQAKYILENWKDE